MAGDPPQKPKEPAISTANIAILAVGVIILTYFVARALGERSPAVAMQTAGLFGTGVVVFWYTYLTDRLHRAAERQATSTSGQLESLRTSLTSTRRGQRAVARLHGYALRRNLEALVGRETGLAAAAKLYSWFAKYGAAARAEAWTVTAGNTERRLERLAEQVGSLLPAEVEALKSVVTSFYEAADDINQVVHSDQMRGERMDRIAVIGQLSEAAAYLQSALFLADEHPIEIDG